MESFISIKILSSFSFEATKAAEEAEAEAVEAEAATAMELRPPFRAIAWLRFRDGFEAAEAGTVVVEAAATSVASEAAATFP